MWKNSLTMGRLPRLLIGLLVALSTETDVSAAPVSFIFSGTVSAANIDFDPYDRAVRAGTTFSGNFTFDETAVDQRPDKPRVGMYFLTDERSSLVVAIGGLSFTARAFSIQVNDLDPDSYFIFAHTPFTGPSGTTVTLLALKFRLGSPDVFKSDSLPRVPPDPARFENKEFSLSVSGSDRTRGPASITGRIDALTLAPANPVKSSQ